MQVPGLNELKASLSKAISWIEARTVRERAMLLGASIAVTFMLWDVVMLSPLEATAKRHSSDIQRAQQDLSNLQDSQLALLQRAGQDPDKDNREQRELLRREIALLNERLQAMTVTLIDPRKMSTVLEQVLAHETDLELARIESLGQQPLLEPGAAATASDFPGVFRHKFVLEFSGSYLSTLEYLKALEALPWQFYWESIDFQVRKHPQAHVTIVVNTLSLNEAWIGT